MVFDKTGTLTEGKPALRQIVAVVGTEEQLLAVTAAVEASSEHPVARAIVEEAFRRGLPLSEVEGFQAVTGRGVRARFKDQGLTVGSPAFLAAEGVASRATACWSAWSR